MERQLRVAEIVEILNLSEFTVRNYFRDSRFPGAYKIGRSWRLSESDLARWIEFNKGFVDFRKGGNSGVRNGRWSGGKDAEKERKRNAIKTLEGKLGDKYLKTLLIAQKIGLKHSDITPELIKLKRAQLKLTREIKNEKKSGVTAGKGS